MSLSCGKDWDAANPSDTRLDTANPDTTDPDTKESEAHLSAWPDLRPGDDKHAGEVRMHGYSPFQVLFGIPLCLNLPGDNPLLSEIRGNAALLVQLVGVRATL
jgi:hypothetical protein